MRSEFAFPEVRLGMIPGAAAPSARCGHRHDARQAFHDDGPEDLGRAAPRRGASHHGGAEHKLDEAVAALAGELAIARRSRSGR